MPGMDGKGPTGSGPVGRGMGRCRANSMPNNPNQETEMDQAQQPVNAGGNPGMGRGNRCGAGAGKGGGGGRGGGRGQRGGNR